MDKKKYIIDHTQYLFKRHKVLILHFIKNSIPVRINEAMDGCRINLDVIDTKKIDELYDLVIRLENIEIENTQASGSLLSI